MTDTRIWFTPRAWRLHAVILVVVPAFMALCVWQLDRALAGNTLSWAYVFEWPLFAAYAVYMWWRFLHEAPEEAAPGPGTGMPGDSRPGAAATDPEAAALRQHEDTELAAYNAYLAQLAEQDGSAER